MGEALFLLLIIATGQGLFLFLYLLFQRQKNQWTNVLLAFLFLSFSLQMSDFALLFSGKASQYPHFVFLSGPFNFAFGPLLFLYLSNFDSAGSSLRKKDFLHFIPFLLHLGYITAIYHIKDTDYKVEFLSQIIEIQSLSERISIQQTIFPLIIYIHFTIYIIISYRKIKADTRREKEVSVWLNKLWLSILIIGSFGFLQFLLVLLNIQQQPVTGYIAIMLAVGYIYYGAIIVMRKPDVIFKPIKYQYSSLQESERKNLINILKNYMEEHLPYKNPNLTLKELARASDLNERHISQVINEDFNKNFSDFLNEYRVGEFKRQLKDPSNSHLSILGIANSSGFNSKSTFNTAFKRITGQTPSEYKKETDSEK